MVTCLDSDLMGNEFNISFNSNSRIAFLNFEIADDNLSEKEEWFVLYLDVASAQCALAVSIQDNDGN